MTKNDLISAIAEKGGYSKKEAEQALAAVTETITEALETRSTSPSPLMSLKS